MAITPQLKAALLEFAADAKSDTYIPHKLRNGSLIVSVSQYSFEVKWKRKLLLEGYYPSPAFLKSCTRAGYVASLTITAMERLNMDKVDII